MARGRALGEQGSTHGRGGPADALAGIDLDEETRVAVEKGLTGKAAELEAVLAAAEAEAQERAEKQRLIALAHFRAKEVDVFLGDRMPKLDPNSPAAKQPATDAQLASLERHGIAKAPPGLTKGEASAMLDAITERDRAGLATVPQCRLLNKLGVDTKQLTKHRAGQLIAICRARGFKPWVLAHEPEYRRDGRKS